MGIERYYSLILLLVPILISISLADDVSAASKTVEGYDVVFQITGGKVTSIIPDVDIMGLIIEVSTPSNGELTIMLPRSLIDAKIVRNADDDFIVLVDAEEWDFDETRTNSVRTLTIGFPAGTEEIEIIGTQILTPTQTPLLKKIIASNPQALDDSGRPISRALVNEEIFLKIHLKNPQDRSQSYVHLVTVTDDNGVVTSMQWSASLRVLHSGNDVDIGISWFPKTSGTFTIEHHIWESVDNPTLLSPVIQTEVIVSTTVPTPTPTPTPAPTPTPTPAPTPTSSGASVPIEYVIVGIVIAAAAAGIGIVLSKRKKVVPVISTPPAKAQAIHPRDDTQFWVCPNCGQDTHMKDGRQYCSSCKIYLSI